MKTFRLPFALFLLQIRVHPWLKVPASCIGFAAQPCVGAFKRAQMLGNSGLCQSYLTRL